MSTAHIAKGCAMVSILGFVAFYAQPDDLVSRQGYEFILQYEGCKLETYQCSANVHTIGIGHTETTKQQQTIDEREAVLLFRTDVEKRAKVVKQLVTVPITQPQFDMLVSFSFNLGLGNLKSSTLLKETNRGHSILACNQYTRWTYVDGKQCKDRKNNCYGIVKRRESEKSICLNGYKI